MDKHKKLWLLMAPSGLVIIGAGLSMAIDAGFCKMNNESWIGYGTVALIVFNTGICIFGRAVAEMVFYKMKNH